MVVWTWAEDGENTHTGDTIEICSQQDLSGGFNEKSEGKGAKDGF